MESYMSTLQEQSFITNVQASNCAALLGKKLQRANVSIDVYNLCNINLKDFSLQGQDGPYVTKTCLYIFFQSFLVNWQVIPFGVLHFVTVESIDLIHDTPVESQGIV